MKSKASQETSLTQLTNIMDALLAEDGCQWDREQNLASLMPFLVEESYEVIDAVEHGSPKEHCDELGDLLFQIVFQAALRQREGAFELNDVVQSICEKLIRRHPHIFDKRAKLSSDEVALQWDEIKKTERASEGSRRGLLSRVPRGMTPLARASQLSTRAASVGFDWPDADACFEKVKEELYEVVDAGQDLEKVEEEIGDLLFAIVSYARKRKLDVERALRGANHKFVSRFSYVEEKLEERGVDLKSADIKAMDALWNESKSLNE